MYTIDYERDDNVSTLPVWFADKQLAIANACELLKAGFHVAKVEGPGLQMGQQALDAYRRALLTRTEAAPRARDTSRPQRTKFTTSA